MTHNQQNNFCKLVKSLYPSHFTGKWVIDCGSLDINGSNRYLFEDCFYIGVDIIEGKNVNVVSMIHELPFIDDLFDVVISTNALEHDMFWEKSIPKMCRLLKSGGLLLISCSREHPEHGTTKSMPEFSGTSQLPDWANYYRNLNENDLRKVINMKAVFKDSEIRVTRDGRDLFFWGIKH